jgi:ATP-binding cassette subfamily B protein
MKETVSIWEIFRAYFSEARKYPWHITIALVAAVGIQAAELAAPWYMRKIFNILATGAVSETTIHALFVTLGMVAAMWIARWVSIEIRSLSIIRMESAAMKGLYASTFSYLMRHSHTFFISRFAGSLTHKVNKFARGFETMFDALVLEFFPTFLFMTGAVTILYLRNHTLGLMLGVWSILFILFQLYASKLRQPLRVARAQADTQTTGALADAISNQTNIMLFSGTRHEAHKFDTIVDNWYRATLRAWNANAMTWAGVGIFTVTIEIALVYGAIVFWSKGLLEIGDFVLIQAYLLSTFDRLASLNRTLRGFSDAHADAGEMVALLNEGHEIQDAPDARVLAVSSGAIDFKSVEFHFKTERSILEHLDLSIRPGEKVALVGPSGAGKSTITKLLLRMYDVTDGAILIDGQNISQVKQDSLRDAIGFVPQEPILFHRSLMENIRYGKREATDDEVIEAAKKAHCHEFIQGLAQGYDTFVGERGVKLSGGERQRVAIARAILKDAPILVLDEATSSLDSESESLIQDSLKVLMQGKTVLVIAHRLSTIMNMDRIVVLQDGKIVADGTHDELLKEGGLYQKLWSIQAGGFIQDEEE